MENLHTLRERAEAIAYKTPRKDASMDAELYLYLAGEAYLILKHIRSVRNLELDLEIELPYLEKRVQDLEEKISKIC